MTSRFCIIVGPAGVAVQVQSGVFSLMLCFSCSVWNGAPSLFTLSSVC